MRGKIFYLALLLVLISCNVSKNGLIEFRENHSNNNKREDMKNWVFKDLETDSLPGISLERAYELMGNKKSKEVVVAIIDTEVDLNHEDLKGQFWINKQEIPNNMIDDDDNGYIDDYNGWNFIGNNKGENIIYSNLESARIINKFKKKFEKLSSEAVKEQDIENFQLYQRAKDYFKQGLNSTVEGEKYANFLFEGYPKAKKSVDKLFSGENYNIKELDSLFLIYKENDLELAKEIYFISDCLKYDLTEEWISDYKDGIDRKLKYTYNLGYLDRENIDLFPNNIEKVNYGNNKISNNLLEFYHGTMVAGIIGAVRNNNKGIDGVCSNIKIMPIAISSNGDEHDKDIALSIRYAVDNGAKLINMSFGKHFSLYKEWVFEAIKYAEENNVLIITSAGNNGKSLNDYNDYYPNDNFMNGNEVASNFLVVGSSTYNIDSKLISNFSNYGNIDVDIFAPGEEINTTLPFNKYKNDKGTSLSCAVATGIGALVLSYYPNLSGSNLKNILMGSGISYPILVNVPGKENEKMNFLEMSKSGKIINAYNALLVAKDFN